MLKVSNAFGVIFLCFLLHSGQALASVKSEIIWYRADLPPSNFVDGLMEGLGYNDQIQKFFHAQLPEYGHSTVTAGYSRILHNLKSSNGCTIGLLKNPESETFLHYSIPSLLTFPNGIVIRDADYDKFKGAVNHDGYIAIGQMINQTSIRIGIAGGRIYGPGIDTLLDRHERNSNLVKRRGEDAFKSLLQMLDKFRLDYILGYPEELQLYT